MDALLIVGIIAAAIGLAVVIDWLDRRWWTTEAKTLETEIQAYLREVERAHR